MLIQNVLLNPRTHEVRASLPFEDGNTLSKCSQSVKSTLLISIQNLTYEAAIVFTDTNVKHRKRLTNSSHNHIFDSMLVFLPSFARRIVVRC